MNKKLYAVDVSYTDRIYLWAYDEDDAAEEGLGHAQENVVYEGMTVQNTTEVSLDDADYEEALLFAGDP